MAAKFLRNAPPGIISGLLFFAVVLIGCAYIVASKLHAFSALYVTLVPVAIMIAYALLLGLARIFRLRDDQSGDNLYYMGFLFTLTSLAVSLYQFSADGAAEQIVQNFGVAIASTIAGIALRIFFNLMRRDPVEVEAAARLELADAARRVKRELESTVLEFGYFRRSTQQSLSDALDEMNATLTDSKHRLIMQLNEFAETSSRPIEEASRRSGATLDALNAQVERTLEVATGRFAQYSDELSKSTSAMVTSIEGVASKLSAMQTPGQIIEIKLNPMIQGLSRAVNTFSKNAEIQTKAVEANVSKTQQLSEHILQLSSQLSAAQTETNTPPASTEIPQSSQRRDASLARISDGQLPGT
jgi:hypothetical protein